MNEPTSMRFAVSLHRVGPRFSRSPDIRSANVRSANVRSADDRFADDRSVVFGEEAASETVGDHLDWFFQVDPLPAGPSGVGSSAAGSVKTFATPISWELGDAPDAGGGDSIVFAATELAAHRAIYLDYSGEVSGDRGSIRRLAWGRHQSIETDPERFMTRILEVQIDATGVKDAAIEPILAFWNKMVEIRVENSRMSLSAGPTKTHP